MSNAPTNVSEYGVVANVVQHYTDVSRMSLESAHEVGEEALSSFNTAVRATSLVILLMLSLTLVSALLASRSPFTTAEQSWIGITQTNPVAHR